MEDHSRGYNEGSPSKGRESHGKSASSGPKLPGSSAAPEGGGWPEGANNEWGRGAVPSNKAEIVVSPVKNND